MLRGTRSHSQSFVPLMEESSQDTQLALHNVGTAFSCYWVLFVLRQGLAVYSSPAWYSQWSSCPTRITGVYHNPRQTYRDLYLIVQCSTGICPEGEVRKLFMDTRITPGFQGSTMIMKPMDTFLKGYWFFCISQRFVFLVWWSLFSQGSWSCKKIGKEIYKRKSSNLSYVSAQGGRAFKEYFLSWCY